MTKNRSPSKQTKRRERTRETSNDVSSLASKALRIFHGAAGDWVFSLGRERITGNELRSIFASALNQDQTKGLRKAKRAGRKR